ncbi:MAG: flagellar hook-length control protein FliK [Vallitalea sp.]|jgi:flagellar hook-length control protein FliK|nr:flagellar hook-length control protein FliK [Vallitalea sp.]
MASIANIMNVSAGVNNNLSGVSENKANDDFQQILCKESNAQITKGEDNKPVRNMKKVHNKINKVKVNKETNKVKVNKKEDKISTKKEIEEVCLKNVEEEIIDEVKKALNISEEQLNELLKKLNMTIFDLLLPEKLTDFLTTLYNVDDSLQLLTIPNVANNIKELKSKLNDLMNDLDLNKDDIQKIISEINTNMESKKSLKENASQVHENDASQEQSDMDKQKPKITITDNRSEKNIAPEQKTKDIKIQEIKDINIQETKVNIKEELKTESKTELKTEVAEGNKQTIDSVENLNFHQHLQKVEVNQSGEKQIVTYNINTEEVIDQIVSSFKVNLADDSNKMFIQLRPEHLGKLAFSLTSHEGVVTASFMAENPAVKELIQSNLAMLKTSLQDQGIIVEKIEVVVGDNTMFNDQNNSNQYKESNNKKRRAAKMMKIDNYDEEELVEELLVSNEIIPELRKNSSVDYSV